MVSFQSRFRCLYSILSLASGMAQALSLNKLMIQTIYWQTLPHCTHPDSKYFRFTELAVSVRAS